MGWFKDLKHKIAKEFSKMLDSDAFNFAVKILRIDMQERINKWLNKAEAEMLNEMTDGAKLVENIPGAAFDPATGIITLDLNALREFFKFYFWKVIGIFEKKLNIDWLEDTDDYEGPIDDDGPAPAPVPEPVPPE